VIHISANPVTNHLPTEECLLILTMKNSSKTNANPGKPLKTEYPLCEKDEQTRRIEEVRKLQAQALQIWRSLKKKIK
jgi:hypothetical protein